MKLEIKEVKDKGSIEERIVLIAYEDCDLGYYFIFTTKRTKDGTSLSSLIKDAYWIPDKKVKKGDLVVIYSKVGTSSFKINDDNTTSHFYYRNLPGPVLIENKIALLVEATMWKAEKPQ